MIDRTYRDECARRIRDEELRARADGHFDFADQCRVQADRVEGYGDLRPIEWLDRGRSEMPGGEFRDGELWIYLPMSGRWFWFPADIACAFFWGIGRALHAQGEIDAMDVMAFASVLLKESGDIQQQAAAWFAQHESPLDESDGET